MTVYETASDAELLRQVINGDAEAFALLYRRRANGVYRFALQMSGSTAIAEDVTQETFIVLMREAAKYDAAKSTLAAYLYGVARNHVRRCFKRDWRFVSFDVEDEDGANLSPMKLSANDNPLDELTRGETIKRVRRAILSLPEHYREVVVLCELHEVSYADAAVALDCAIGTIRSRLYRARALLVERLRAEVVEGNEKWIAKSLS